MAQPPAARNKDHVGSRGTPLGLPKNECALALVGKSVRGAIRRADLLISRRTGGCFEKQTNSPGIGSGGLRLASFSRHHRHEAHLYVGSPQDDRSDWRHAVISRREVRLMLPVFAWGFWSIAALVNAAINVVRYLCGW